MSLPHEKDQGNRKDNHHRCCQKRQESPFAPGVATRLSMVSLQQQVIATVRLQAMSKRSPNGNGAYQCADAEIDDDRGQRAPRIQAAIGITTESRPAITSPKPGNGPMMDAVRAERIPLPSKRKISSSKISSRSNYFVTYVLWASDSDPVGQTQMSGI